jgi:hypothetical protein
MVWRHGHSFTLSIANDEESLVRKVRLFGQAAWYLSTAQRRKEASNKVRAGRIFIHLLDLKQQSATTGTKETSD